MASEKTTTKKTFDKTTKVEAKMTPKKQHANKTGNLTKQQADAKEANAKAAAKGKTTVKAKKKPKPRPKRK